LAGSESGEKRDETSLVKRIRDGESELFCEMVRDCQRALYTAAFSILRDAGDAEEVCQEAIAKAWAGLRRFRMESKFSTWLVQITMNEARMRLRKERKHRFRSIDENFETGSGIYVPEQLIEWRRIPSKELERKRMREALVRAFECLPEKYREIFVLRDVQGLTITQTAKLVGITESTVKTRLLRARLRMRDLLSAEATLKPNAPVVLRRAAAVPCVLVWRRVSDYVDNDVPASTRSAIELHIADCRPCRAVVGGVRNVVLLFGDPRLFPLPKGFRRRALQKLRSHMTSPPPKRGVRTRLKGHTRSGCG
jgi:RNA polymerase sigma-70 factor, ECF subfamily